MLKKQLALSIRNTALSTEWGKGLFPSSLSHFICVKSIQRSVFADNCCTADILHITWPEKRAVISSVSNLKRIPGRSTPLAVAALSTLDIQSQSSGFGDKKYTCVSLAGTVPSRRVFSASRWHWFLRFLVTDNLCKPREGDTFAPMSLRGCLGMQEENECSLLM